MHSGVVDSSEPMMLLTMIRRCLGMLDDLQGFFKVFIPAFCNGANGFLYRMSGENADKVMLGMVVFDDSHPGPGDAETAGQRKLVDIAVGASSGSADDIAELVVFDNAHHAFGIADGAGVGQKDHFAAQSGKGRGHAPSPRGVVASAFQAIGIDDMRHLESGRTDAAIGQVAEDAVVSFGRASQVKYHPFGLFQLIQVTGESFRRDLDHVNVVNPILQDFKIWSFVSSERSFEYSWDCNGQGVGTPCQLEG